MKVFGTLDSACTEILASDPLTTVQGRFWFNSTAGTLKLDDGTTKRSILRNDSHAVIGNSGAAGDNIRFHRGAASLLQLVLASDATAEGSLSSALAFTSGRIENYTDVGKPAAGNAGRLLWITDTSRLLVDNGTTYQAPWTFDQLSPLTTKGDLITRTTTQAVRLGVGVDGTFLKANSSTTEGIEWSSAVANKVVTSVITTYLAVTTDDVILADASGGAFTITLFSAVGNTGKTLTIKKTDSSTNAITIDADGGQTIDDSLTTTLNTMDESITFYSDGSDWQIEIRRIPSIWVTASASIGITATTTNPTKGTVVVDEVRWRRVGDSAHIRMYYRQNAGSGGAGSGDYLFAIPSEIGTIDTSKVRVYATVEGFASNFVNAFSIGHGYAGYNVDDIQAEVVPFDSTRVRIFGGTVGATIGVIGSAGYPLTFTNLFYALDFIVPISGWKG